MVVVPFMGHTANWYAHASLPAKLLRTCLYGGPCNLQQHNSDIHTIEQQQTSQELPAFTCLHPTADLNTGTDWLDLLCRLCSGTK